MVIKFKEPIITITVSEYDKKIKSAQQEIFKSLLTRLIHCTDGSRYEEDMIDDYWGLICDLGREYKEKYGEELEDE